MKLSKLMMASAVASLAMSPAIAKPVNAAVINEFGFVGCVVRASEADPYVFDATCQSHTVSKRDRDGNRVFIRYQDKGELQPGQTAPDRAVRIEFQQFSFGTMCDGTEVISPSGQYSSTLDCKY